MSRHQPHPTRRAIRQIVLVAVSVLLVGSACVSDSDPEQEQSLVAEQEQSLVAAVASFDLSPDREERFIVGLYSSNRGEVALGSVNVSFSYFGAIEPARPGPREPATPPAPTVATYLPIPGSTEPPSGGDPTLNPPDGVRGVYGTAPLRFETAGFWEVLVEAEVDGTAQTARAAFEVFETSLVVGPGDMAPRTVQPLLGDSSVEPKTVDSRLAFSAEPDDPLLHQRTIADTLEAGKPAMVVVSTPVFCVSRFCGPITDEISQLASQHDGIEFIHLEVWSDFAANELSPWALEWIAPRGQSEAAEPWVFLVDGDGTITDRWDNVASSGELEAAIRTMLGP